MNGRAETRGSLLDFYGLDNPIKISGTTILDNGHRDRGQIVGMVGDNDRYDSIKKEIKSFNHQNDFVTVNQFSLPPKPTSHRQDVGASNKFPGQQQLLNDGDFFQVGADNRYLDKFHGLAEAVIRFNIPSFDQSG